MLDADDDDEVVVDEAFTSKIIMLKNTFFSPFCKFLGNVVFFFCIFHSVLEKLRRRLDI